MTEVVIEWLRNWGNLSLSSGIALGFIFVVANFVPFPRTFLCFGAGTIFGLWAIPIIATSTTVGPARSTAPTARSCRCDRWRKLAGSGPPSARIANPHHCAELFFRHHADSFATICVRDIRFHHSANRIVRLHRRARTRSTNGRFIVKS